MPIYEYICENCNTKLEVIQKISDEVLKKCPQCKKARLQKAISQSSFSFKGSGWYISDYSSKPSATSGKTENTDSKDKSKSSVDSVSSEAKSSKTKLSD